MGGYRTLQAKDFNFHLYMCTPRCTQKQRRNDKFCRVLPFVSCTTRCRVTDNRSCWGKFRACAHVITKWLIVPWVDIELYKLTISTCTCVLIIYSIRILRIKSWIQPCPWQQLHYSKVVNCYHSTDLETNELENSSDIFLKMLFYVHLGHENIQLHVHSQT